MPVIPNTNDHSDRKGSLGYEKELWEAADLLRGHHGTLVDVARGLVESVRNSVSIDWTEEEAVRAKMRARVKRLLRRGGYPHDKREEAVVTVLEQAEGLCRDWAPVNGDGGGPASGPPARIVRDPEGIPVIAGANTKVVELVSHLQARGGTPQEIHAQLPHLSVEQVEAGLAFYAAHRQEIDDDLARRLERVERLRREMPEAPIVEKILRMRDEG